MTEIQAIDSILNAKKPTDLFSGDWKTTYKKLSRLVHPDTCSDPRASDAMATLNDMKDLLENGEQFTDETGDFKVFDKKIIYKVTDDNRKLIRQSFENFKILKMMKDKTSIGFHRYIPESMRLSKYELIISFADRAVPLTGQQLPQIHVNWIFSRMFEFNVWLSQVGYSHMGLNPTTVFVVPETHGIIITSFYHMTKLGTKAKTISAKYKMWYPTTLFTEKIATPDVDLELTKKIAIYLLGDKSAAGTKLKRDKDVNQEVLTFLLTKHNNEFSDYEKYRKLLADNFEKKFYPLNL